MKWTKSPLSDQEITYFYPTLRELSNATGISKRALKAHIFYNSFPKRIDEAIIVHELLKIASTNLVFVSDGLRHQRPEDVRIQSQIKTYKGMPPEYQINYILKYLHSQEEPQPEQQE